jgi:hypothetical protein
MRGYLTLSYNKVFSFELFLEARAETKNNFVGFLVQIRTRNCAFEIN